MRKNIFVLLSIFLFPIFVFADTSNISNLVFTTEKRTVSPGVISEAITVQTQNSSGASEKVSETNDVEFSSTSGSGEFLGSTGNPVTTTMSKNTASRTFYYRDSAEGTYTLTVTIKGRETGTTFSASQQITVGEGDANTSGNEDSEQESETTNDELEENNDTNTSDVSSHSNSENLSSTHVRSRIKADAGRKRVVSVNSPIKFEAGVSGTDGKINYEWSFGDGQSKNGQIATHTYLFPGEYNVVLNVNVGTEKAVSRTTVKVVDASISLLSVGNTPVPFVELKNNSSSEINIQGFEVRNEKDVFTFSEDTIMPPKTVIKFPIPFKNVKNNEIGLFFPNKMLADGSEKQSKFLSEDYEIQLKKANDDILKAQALIREISPTSTTITIQEPLPTSQSTSSAVVPSSTQAEISISTSSQSALLIEALEENDEGVIQIIKSIPEKGFEIIKGLFRNQ